MKRRIFAGFLALVMVLGMMPAQIFATETEDYTEPVIVETEAVVETTAPAMTEEVTTEPEDPEPSEPEQPETETTAATEEVTEATAEATEETMPEDIPTVIDLETTPAADAVIYVTISNAGVLASAKDESVMVEKAVTVKDINSDGYLTVAEALTAAHEAYCTQGTDGFAYEDGTYSTGYATKLWGVANGGSYLFLINNIPLGEGIASTKSTVKAGDKLYAAVMKDTKNYADFYSYFDKDKATVEAGESLTLTLKGFLGMGYTEDQLTAKALGSISLGTWEKGSFTALTGKTTDENGRVTLSFDKAGTYYVTASGTVPTTDWMGNEAQAPIMAPYCVVTVEGSTTDPSEPEQPAKHYLSELTFRNDIDAASAELKLTPAFNADVREYTLVVPDNVSPVVFAWATLADGTTGTITAKYTSLRNTQEQSKPITSGSESGKLLSALITSGNLNANTLTIYLDEEAAYTIHVLRSPTLKELSLTAGGEEVVLDKTFSGATTEYSVAIAHDAELTVTATTNLSNVTVTVNGKTDTVVKPVWDEHTSDITIKLSAEGAADAEYVLHLNQSPTKLEVVTQPTKTQYKMGETADITGIQVKATYVDGSTELVDADKLTVTPTEQLKKNDTAITLYYNGAKVAYPITVSCELKGSGTQEAPWLLETEADLETLRKLVATGISFEGEYLKMTDDITLPEDWEGIGCRINPSVSHIDSGKNLAPFSGTLDGDGHTVTVPEGGLPLFGYVKGATVKNLNIFGKKIAGYGLVNHLEGVSLSGNAITIDNVTLKSGSSTQKAGFIGTYITNNGFAGCSAAFVVTIKNSTIEEGVVIGYDADQSMIGSFAGRVHGTIENCVSYATVKGTSYVGGILGTRDNAMGTCTVNNCQFYGTVEASGEHAGGIVGGGYSNSTAPNGNIPTITNCTVKATVTGKDKVGGIFGGDTYVAQSWGGWTLSGNTFSGTVNATEGTYVGGIIGYLLSMNKYTGISGNSYANDCGAKNGIGYVKYLDTSAESPTAFDGTEVFDTSKGVDACPTVSGCSWQKDHNRTDDPLGKDADKLCKMLEAEPLGVVFTSGDQEFTLNFEEGKAEYTVALEDMANAKLTVKGTASGDTVTLDGEAIPEGGKEYTLSSTATTILLKINDTSYTLYVTNTVNYRLSSLELYTTQAAYQAGDAPLKITPSFDGNTFTGYSAAAPDYVTALYMVGQVTPTPDKSILVAIGNAWGGWSGIQTTGTFKSSDAYYTYKGYVGVYLNNNRDEEYQITINPYATLKSLTLDGVMDKDFNRDITSYHAYVDDTAEGVKITATGYKSAYTITVNGKEVTAGESYTLPYVWDENGKMAVEIQVSGANVSTSTYTFQLEKTPVGNKPFVLKESAEADYTIIDKASYVKDLFVIASADGELSYQWFYNTWASTEDGTAIEEATASTYTPPITEVGTRYYYCRITNAGAETGNVTYSTPTRVTVDPDPTPIATIVNPGQELTDDNWNVGYRYKVGEQATGLEVTASSAAEGKLTYQWRKYTRGYNILGYSTAAGDATSSVYYPATDISQTNDTGFYYFCEVTNTFKGRTYTAKATTGAKYTDPNTETTYDVNGVYVLIQVDNAAVPEFKTQPVGAKYLVGDSMTSLSTRATIADGGTLTYQWYVNDTPDTEGATAIANATRTSYSLGKATEEGTHYYFCVATNTIQGYSSSTTSDIVEIKIRTEQSIYGDSFVGSGTEEDPFQIATPEDYKSVAAIVADGGNFQGYYLKQTADITLPENWEGIGCLIDPSVGHINAGKNMAAFSGTLDGGGHTITIPEGGLPLFGYVKGATVKNLNIFGKKIAGYGLVNHLEGVSLSGNAITIDNVTLKSGSSTQKAGFIGTYITNNGFAGCSAAYTVTIRNSTIEKDVVIGYDADQRMIGSFAGRVHGTIENCVSYATVKGTDYVGGIIGTVDNAMGACVVRNSQFYGTVEASGEHAGGILGGGYCNSTAPNGVVPTITGCTVNASVTGKDKVGGIMGGDSFVAQSWGLWKLTGNTFSGTLTATEGTYVGGIVGYLLSMNKFTGISDNYYIPGSAERAIGYVKYLDTSFENPTTFEGTEVFDTSKGTDACPTVSGCGWRENHNRTDDPLNEKTTVTGQATAIASISGTTQLLAGKSTTLKALDENGKAITSATWTLAEESEDYVTLTVKSGVATVKAMDVSEGHEVTLTAHADGGADRKVTLTLIPKAQAIALSGDATITLDIGKENYTVPTLKATVLPGDATQSVTWTSSNKKVATVEDGKLTLTGTLGITKITATTTDGSKLSASATVNVVDLAQSIDLTGAESILGGKTATYAAAEEDGTAIKAANITWSLDDTTYASVNTSGKVTTKAVPETTNVILTATIKGSQRHATKEITIVPAATYLDILEAETVVTGKTLKCNVNAEETTLNLTAAAYPADADQNVKWTTSNAKVATVENGTVTYAGKPGTVTITATTTDGSNKKATVKITFAALSTKVEIANPAPESETTLRSGSKLTLSASTDLAKVGVNWSLENAADKNYVTLSGSKLTAKTVYETHEVTLIATAKDGGATATTTVTIKPKDDNVLILKHGDANVTKTTQSVNRSEGTYTLTAANVAGNAQNVTWKTSNKKIVSLAETEGTEVKLNLLKAGTATITATAEDGSKTTVTIKVTTLVESLTITGSDTVASGKAITLKAVATPSTAANKAVTWSLAAGSEYATISSSGKLTANKNLMSEKTVTVQATAKDGSGATATTTVTIQPVATSVVMEQKAQTVDMQQMETLQLSAKVYPATVNKAINWTSSSTKIATVDSKGEVTFHKGGTVTITATAADGSGKKASVKLTVVKSVESLELDNNFLAGGKSLNLAKLLEVGPSDATNKKVIWTMTGDTAYATLSSAGVLKAKTVTQMKTVTVTATAADGYGAQAAATIEIYPATTKVVIQADGETATGTLTLPEGDSLQLSAISLPLDAYQDWTWTSSKSAWAEVDETGCVTGLTAGKTVTITATAKDGTNKKATLKIKIVND